MISLETVGDCPICSSTKFNSLLALKDFSISQESFSIVKCSDCGFLITSPRPDSDSIGKYYQSEKYISHSGGKKTIIDKIYFLAQRLTLRWKYNLIRSYKSKCEILDYGCGTGAFLDFLQKRRWDVTGVEPSAIARIKAESSLQKKIYQSLDDNIEKKFDVITLWHVLEHIHELEDAIQKIKNLLKENGIIFIAVPNYESADAIKYREHWAAYDVPRHLWHFSKTTIERLLVKHKLILLEIKPMKLDSYYVCTLSEGYKNPNQSKIVNAIKGIINGLKSNFAGNKAMNYSSLIYVIKK